MIKDTTDTVVKFSDISTELERFYRFVVDEKGLDPLKFSDPMITIQTAGRKKAYGWHSKDRWEDQNGHLRTEINLSAEYINRPAEDICETIIHEMAHLVNSKNGIKDCTPTQYHNKHFKTSAEALGLVVEKVKQRGYAKTSLGPEAAALIEKFKPNAEVFTLVRNNGTGGSKTDKKESKTFGVQISNVYKEDLAKMAEAEGISKKRFIEILLDKALASMDN